MKTLRLFLLSFCLVTSCAASLTERPLTTATEGSQNPLDLMRFRIDEIKAEQAELDEKLPQHPTKKKVARLTVGTGLALAGANYLFAEQTRSIDGGTLLAMGIGSALTAGAVYAFIGREMGVIVGFKQDLKQIAAEHKKMQELVAQLKAQEVAVQQQLAAAQGAVEEVQGALPQVLAVSGDNAQLAGILQDAIIPEIRDIERVVEQQQITITELLHRVPESERDAVLEAANISTESRQKGLVREYNKWRVRHRVSSYKEIPSEWLRRHGYKR